jgi:Uma2 family endonuclease
MDNLAYKSDGGKDFFRKELYNGKVVLMAPPLVNHGIVTGNICRIFGNYLRGRKCKVYPDNVGVWFTKDDMVIPDVKIVCKGKSSIVQTKGIVGTPDLVAEVLSSSTAKIDRGYKKDLYEKHGVTEYWIIEPKSRSIEVYLLKNGRYVLDNVYSESPDYEIDPRLMDEGDEIISEFKVSLANFEDLIIKTEEIFEGMI